MREGPTFGLPHGLLDDTRWYLELSSILSQRIGRCYEKTTDGGYEGAKSSYWKNEGNEMKATAKCEFKTA